MEQKNIFIIVAAGVLAIGILVGGFLIGRGFYMSRMGDRYVTVKGLAEKDVVADLAVWNVKIAKTGDILADVQGGIDTDKKEMLSFLKAQGIDDAEIQNSQLNVTDLMAQQYRSEGAQQSRFILTFSVTVRSNDVNKVKAATEKIGDLVKKGVVLADNTGPNYIFTKLNDIKPEMIAIATKNARAAAEQFAKDSGSDVGVIRRASQGIFSIETRDGAPVEYQDGGMIGSESKQIEKKVRVVSTIDYMLKG